MDPQSNTAEEPRIIVPESVPQPTLDGIRLDPVTPVTIPVETALPAKKPSKFMDFLVVLIIIVLAASAGWWLANRNNVSTADGATVSTVPTASPSASPSPSTSSSINPLDR